MSAPLSAPRGPDADARPAAAPNAPSGIFSKVQLPASSSHPACLCLWLILRAQLRPIKIAAKAADALAAHNKGAAFGKHDVAAAAYVLQRALRHTRVHTTIVRSNTYSLGRAPMPDDAERWLAMVPVPFDSGRVRGEGIWLCAIGTKGSCEVDIFDTVNREYTSHDCPRARDDPAEAAKSMLAPLVSGTPWFGDRRQHPVFRVRRVVCGLDERRSAQYALACAEWELRGHAFVETGVVVRTKGRGGPRRLPRELHLKMASFKVDHNPGDLDALRPVNPDPEPEARRNDLDAIMGARLAEVTKQG